MQRRKVEMVSVVQRASLHGGAVLSSPYTLPLANEFHSVAALCVIVPINILYLRTSSPKCITTPLEVFVHKSEAIADEYKFGMSVQPLSFPFLPLLIF